MYYIFLLDFCMICGTNCCFLRDLHWGWRDRCFVWINSLPFYRHAPPNNQVFHHVPGYIAYVNIDPEKETHIHLLPFAVIHLFPLECSDYIPF